MNMCSYKCLYCNVFVKEQKRYMSIFIALLISFYILTPQEIPSARRPKGEEPSDPMWATVWLQFGFYNVA